MSTPQSFKSWLAHQLAAFIGALSRNLRSVQARKILIDSIFEPYFSWRPLTLAARTAFGTRMHLALPDSIQTSIFLTGRWEPTISAIVEDALKPGDIFIDIGANVGYYTLLASKLVGADGKVFAFEASPMIFRRLQANVELNSFQQARIFNVAVSNGPGTVSIWTAPQGNLGHSTIIDSVAATDGHLREAEVRCDALRSLLPRPDLLAARLVKIDIEGAERLAIEGILEELSQFSERTEWLVELSPGFSPGGATDTDWIFAAFLRAGYQAFRLENSYGPLSGQQTRAPGEGLIRLHNPPQERLNDVLFSRSRATAA